MPNSFVNASNSRRLKFFSYSYFIFSPDVFGKKGCFPKRHLKSKGVISSALSALAKQYHKCNENTRRLATCILGLFCVKVYCLIVAANLLHRILLFSTSDKMSHLQHFIKDFPSNDDESDDEELEDDDDNDDEEAEGDGDNDAEGCSMMSLG